MRGEIGLAEHANRTLRGRGRIPFYNAVVIAIRDEQIVSAIDGDTFGAVGKGLTIEAVRRYGPAS